MSHLPIKASTYHSFTPRKAAPKNEWAFGSNIRLANIDRPARCPSACHLTNQNGHDLDTTADLRMLMQVEEIYDAHTALGMISYSVALAREQLLAAKSTSRSSGGEPSDSRDRNRAPQNPHGFAGV